jgi:hypothetical protein
MTFRQTRIYPPHFSLTIPEHLTATGIYAPRGPWTNPRLIKHTQSEYTNRILLSLRINSNQLHSVVTPSHAKHTPVGLKFCSHLLYSFEINHVHIQYILSPLRSPCLRFHEVKQAHRRVIIVWEMLSWQGQVASCRKPLLINLKELDGYARAFRSFSQPSWIMHHASWTIHYNYH